MSERDVKQVRTVLGQRLRARRRERGLSQERLGERADLSAKFIGEVERGEKAISIESLFHLSMALEVALRDLTDMATDRSDGVRQAGHHLSAVAVRAHRPEHGGRAHELLRAMFAPQSS